MFKLFRSSLFSSLTHYHKPSSCFRKTKSATALIATFTTGILGASAIDHFYLKNPSVLIEKFPSASLMKIAVLSSPFIISGISFVVFARLWQLSCALGAITVANPISGRIAGVLGVGLSGACTISLAKTWNFDRPTNIHDLVEKTRKRLLVPFDFFRDFAVSLAIYSILGGSWVHILPSSVLFSGAFANSNLGSILSMRSLVQARANTRDTVAILGEFLGCHSCGVRRGPFVTDLSPPVDIASFYSSSSWWRRSIRSECLPQCVSCSGKQAIALRNWVERPWYSRPFHVGHSAVVTHMGSFRRFDLTGVVLGMMCCTTPVLFSEEYMRRGKK